MINFQAVLSVIGATALLAVGAWLGRCSVEEPTPRMAIEFKQHAMTEHDLPEPTTANAVTVYERPDSTRTECIQVPTWLDRLRSTSPLTTSTPASDSLMQQGVLTDSLIGAENSGRIPSTARSWKHVRGLPYVITPMTNGRPSLSVGSQTVTLSAINPRNGQGLEYSYDIPQSSNRLSPYASAQMIAGLPAAHMGAEYAHTWRDFWIFSSATAEWHGGYGITPEGPGEVFGATVTADIKW